MLEAILKTKNPMFWILLHVVLGIAFSLIPFGFVLWFSAFFLTSLGGLAKGSKNAQSVYLIQFLTYAASLELLGRMTRAFKYGLPWEYGKYIVFFSFLYSVVVLGNRKGTIGFLMVFLLLPSLFIHPVLEFRFNELIYNGFGPLAVSLAIIGATKLPVSKLAFQQILKLLFYPSVMVLAYTAFRTPDFDSLEFTLGAQFDTTGGYGSNQVSTVLGLGLFISLVFFVNKWLLTGNRIADGFLVFAFGFQGLLSFSRGGVLGAILGLLIVLYFFASATPYQRKKFVVPNVSKYVFPVALLLVITWSVANEITGGVLTQRYAGETNSTLAGNREKDINTLTSGRLEISTREFQIWGDYFVFGAGLGSSKHLRATSEYGGVLAGSHVELTRLMAEHGLLGITYFMILMYLGLKLFKKNNNPRYQSLLLALFTIAIFTTFHAAMRTYVTPLLIGLSMLKIEGINMPEEVIKKRKTSVSSVHANSNQELLPS